MTNKTLILGLGNILMGDEGVGVHVARKLETLPLPAAVEVLDGGTGGFVLLEPLLSAARIVMIDASADGNAVGTITRLTPRFSKDYPTTLTAHDVGVKDLLDIYSIQGGAAEVILFAITIDPHQPISLALSAPIAQAAEDVVERVLQEVDAAIYSGTPLPI